MFTDTKQAAQHSGLEPRSAPATAGILLLLAVILAS